MLHPDIGERTTLKSKMLELNQGRKVLQEGDMDAGVWSCGMVAGLIHDIPTCAELIGRIMSEADEIIRGRLEGLLS